MFFNNILNKRKKAECGFTLVELLLTTVVLGIVLISLAALMRVSFKSVASSETTTRSEQPVTFALNMITRDVRSAKTVTCTSTSQLTATDVSGTSVSYSFNATDRTLLRDGVLLAEDVTGKFQETSGLYEINITSNIDGEYQTTDKSVNLQSTVTKRN